MNLQSSMENEAAAGRATRLHGQPRRARFVEGIFGQSAPARLVFPVLPMLLSFARKTAVCFCWGLLLALPAAVFGQTNYYGTNGTEYSIVGALPGDQVWPDVAVNPGGGFVVWQDNATDGSGWGVSARRLDGTLSGTLSTFRVNVTGTNDQENARVALLKNGGAVFVWQGGVEGYQHIYARFLTPTNTWLTTTDVMVSVPANNFQINPAVAVLNNSNTVVVWGSFDEAGASTLQDVYGQVFTPDGQKSGGEFLVNQFTSYNQRTPAIAALAGGGFVVAWVSEQERSLSPNLGTGSTNTTALPIYTSPTGIATPSVDIFARLYDGNANALGGEFLVNSNAFPCANPAVAAASDGSFMVAWGAHNTININNSWDIYARSYSSPSPGAGGPIVTVNTTLSGDQYAPRISAIGTDYLVAWTSLGQDGSREGVYGQFVHAGGGLVGGEFRVNTTTIGQQMQPAVASDGTSQFVAVWTSSPGYTGTPYNFDLFAQRYLNLNLASNPPPLSAPFVWAPFTLSNGVYQPQLMVSWSSLLGISVSAYQVFADGTNAPTAIVTGNQWTMTASNNLTAGSTHSFQVAYTTTGGGQSPLSAATTNSTWSGLNWGGIPYEWMAAYFGGYYGGVYHTNFWPAASSPVAPGGPTLLQVFRTGANPFDSSTWLKTGLVSTPQGLFLNWNTQPGHTYQVQATTNFTSWNAVPNASARFAAGTNDSIYVGGGSAGYYRVQFLY
jgi:hypothetical protein